MRESPSVPSANSSSSQSSAPRLKEPSRDRLPSATRVDGEIGYHTTHLGTRNSPWFGSKQPLTCGAISACDMTVTNAASTPRPLAMLANRPSWEVTFRELAEHWLASHRHVKHSTRVGYESKLRCAVTRYIGDRPLVSLTVDDMAELVLRMEQASYSTSRSLSGMPWRSRPPCSTTPSATS